ncbi:MAG: tetratricopeptide repeat protein [Bdellovibrionales bacterium]|nr:tetratricopeptide repeat protein [Bdellovibrionales bacterium]
MTNRPLLAFAVGLSLLIGIGAHARITNDEYASVQSPKEQQIEAIRLEEIKAVKTALSLRAPENRKAELYLRLAELYLEAYRADFLLEGRLHEGQLQTQPGAKLERGRSVDDLRFGIGSAEEILKLKVETNKLDKVYYFLGYNYGELGSEKKSLEYYRKLTKEFPDSIYAVEGMKAVADDEFRKQNFSEAKTLYEQALTRTKDPSQQARIYHKLAWCYYRLRRSADALEAMKKAIALAQTDKEKMLSIREEGLRDIAIFYAETGRVEEAIDYFKKNAGGGENGEAKLIVTLEKLGKEYERTGQTDKAKQVYDVLLRYGKTDESSFRVAVKLIDLDLLRQNYDSAYKRLVAIQIPKGNDPETRLAVSNLKKIVRQTAVSSHDRYRNLNEKEIEDKTNSGKYLRAADQFYSIYLAKFLPNDVATKAERNEVRMYLAEIKRDSNQPGAAADLYKIIIQDQDPKYAKEAAKLWVGSIAEELKKRAASGEKPGSDPSQLEKDFVDASNLLEQSIPDSTESREARLRAAQILAAYPTTRPEAIARAQKLAKDAPDTPQGVLAARLWLQLQPTKETVQAIKDEPILLATDAKQKGELAKALDETNRGVRVGEIANLEKSKNYGEAAKGYEEFARAAKDEKEADKAYMGALNGYAQAGNSEEVARVMKEWKTRFPKSKLVESTVKNQATQFFIRGLFNDSAELFLGIGRQFKDSSSVLTSAALFDGGLQRKKAVEVYKLALNMTNNEEERAKIHQSSAYVYNDDKDDLGALNEWKACYAMDSSLKAECGSMIGNYYLRQNDFRQAKSIYNQVVQIKKGASSKSPFIAYAQFRIAQIQEKEMKAPALSFPEEQLLKIFNQRVEELKPVSDSYQKAIELGGPWGIAATERLGDLSLALSNEVNRILQDPKATPQLKQALGAVANALLKKAVDNSKTAYAQAVKREILSPALPVIQDRLVDAHVSGHYRAQGARAGVKLIGVSPDGGKVGQDKAFADTRDRLIKNQEDALAWVDYGNLLWGTGKPGLSKVAYQRSLELKTRRADALNNLAVVLVSDQGYENWYAANEAVALWKKALRYETMNSAALFNLGHYFNYFRLFKHALPYYQKVATKVNIGEVHDGLAVAYWGLGQKTEGELEFNKAEETGTKRSRFVRDYVAADTAGSKADCLKIVEGMGELKGFEKISVDRQRARCSQ